MACRQATSSEGWKHSREDQIQLLLRLEAKLQGYNKRIVHSRENESLRKGMRDLSSINDMLFPDRLQSIYPPGIEFPYLQDLNYPENRPEKTANIPKGELRIRSRITLASEIARRMGELAFPKLPFPITVISSKSSILRGPYRIR